MVMMEDKDETKQAERRSIVYCKSLKRKQKKNHEKGKNAKG